MYPHISTCILWSILDNLDKLAPERQSILVFNEEQDDVVVAAAGSYANYF